MDVMGGAGICRGPSNLVGNGYMSLPIAITVEGANILTRSMITFGQGLNRAHPNLISIINSIEKGNDVKGFTTAVQGFLGHLGSNIFRSLSRAVARPRSKTDQIAYYEGQLSRLASNFAVCADLALVLGGRLKFEEMLSGRFADAFGTLYLGYACLWYAQKNKDVEGLSAVAEMALETILKQNQTALYGITNNFPVPGIGLVMRTICFPTGAPYEGPTDQMIQKVAKLISTESGIRNKLSEGIFISSDSQDRLRQLNDALPLAIKADQAVAAAKKAKRSLTAEEAQLVKKVEELANVIVQVDVFDKLGNEKKEDASYIRPALQNTKFVKMYQTVGAKA
jgi:hypothetical protein